ncbi:hypothetical protein AOLI_G00075490 [Acnodon oligacanthus]
MAHLELLEENTPSRTCSPAVWLSVQAIVINLARQRSSAPDGAARYCSGAVVHMDRDGQDDLTCFSPAILTTTTTTTTTKGDPTAARDTNNVLHPCLKTLRQQKGTKWGI